METNGARLQEGSGTASVPCRAFAARGAAGLRWREALADVPLRAARGARGEAGEGGTEEPQPTRTLWLDSFDRRLEQAGVALRVEAHGPGAHCRLTQRGAAGDEQLALARLPEFAWDFPPGAAQRLGEVLEARALRPLGEHELTCTSLDVLDEERKVVVRVDEELHRVRRAGPGARWSAPVRRIVLRGVRGYDAELERLAQRLARAPGLVPLAEIEFDPRARFAPARGPAGRWPRLSPHTTSLEALARIARAQLAVVRANALGLRTGVDAEHLHDTRVALRRLRSLVSELEGVLAEDERAELGAELRWLAACTGPARDLDVLLFDLRLSAPELRAELAPLEAALVAERARLQGELCAALASPRARALRARLRTTFAGAGDPACAGPKAAWPFAPLLAKRLRRRWRKVVARAERLDAGSPAAELHALRIAAKKLRYLLECCRGLAPKAELADVLRRLKGLQEALGQVQDSEVHTALARELALTVAVGAGARAHLALGRFLERLEQRGRAARAHQAERVAQLLAHEARAELQATLRALALEPTVR